MILTKDALQVAMRKKDVADTERSRQHRLLTLVTTDRRDRRSGIGSTIAELTVDAINAALSRTLHTPAHRVGCVGRVIGLHCHCGKIAAVRVSYKS